MIDTNFVGGEIVGNLLRQLQKDNEKLEAQLLEESLQYASKLYAEFYSPKVKLPYMEEIRKRSLESILARIGTGADLDEAFYQQEKNERKEEIMIAPKKSFFENTVEYGMIFFMSILLLFVLEGLTAGVWARYFQGDFTTRISLGFLISCLLITGLCMVIYGLLSTEIFDLRAKKNLPKSIFVGGFVVIFFVALISQYTLQHIVLFEVNGWVASLILLLLGLICKMLERIQMNRVMQQMRD